MSRLDVFQDKYRNQTSRLIIEGSMFFTRSETFLSQNLPGRSRRFPAWGWDFASVPADDNTGEPVIELREPEDQFYIFVIVFIKCYLNIMNP